MDAAPDGIIWNNQSPICKSGEKGELLINSQETFLPPERERIERSAPPLRAIAGIGEVPPPRTIGRTDDFSAGVFSPVPAENIHRLRVRPHKGGRKRPWMDWPETDVARRAGISTPSPSPPQIFQQKSAALKARQVVQERVDVVIVVDIVRAGMDEHPPRRVDVEFEFDLVPDYGDVSQQMLIGEGAVHGPPRRLLRPNFSSPLLVILQRLLRG
mmetsp:Transcript_62040/g.183257  ORF Transcript_62040/g.183257 Transcript_62040/m.183257 type:complete len:214 (-) Transcript_62040:44-685(-)